MTPFPQDDCVLRAGDIARFLRVLHGGPDLVFEVRVPHCRERLGADFTTTVSGYYQSIQIEKAAAAIADLDASSRAPTIYVTLNPVNPALLARSNNQLKSKAKETSADKDIVRRRWLLIDCDPVRPSGISATDAEVHLATLKAAQVRAFLTESGWPSPVVAMSGNGIHLLYRIDLPADDGGLVERVLKALAARFDDGAVKIDTSVHNAARITKVAGTMAAGKGDDLRGVEGIEDRPHRRSQLLEVPEAVQVVSAALLDAVAGPAPGPLAARLATRANATTPSQSGRFERFDHSAAGVQGYLSTKGVEVTRLAQKDGASFLYLRACPINPDCVSTSDTDIAVVVAGDGKIAYKNLHNRGTGLTWVDVREALEPGYRAFAESAARGPLARSGVSGPTPTVDQAECPSRIWPMPRPLPVELPSVAALDPEWLPVAFRDRVVAISDRVQWATAPRRASPLAFGHSTPVASIQRPSTATLQTSRPSLGGACEPSAWRPARARALRKVPSRPRRPGGPCRWTNAAHS